MKEVKKKEKNTNSMYIRNMENIVINNICKTEIYKNSKYCQYKEYWQSLR